MVRRFTILLIFVLLSVASYGQEVQWASEILDFSSEMSERQYSAAQVLGKPDALPVDGESPNAWTPRRPNRDEFLKVAFSQPMRIRQVAIAENFNPTAVKAIYTYDPQGNEYKMVELNANPDPNRGRMLNVFFDLTTHAVAAVKVEFDGNAVPGYYSIDAIGISPDAEPVQPEVNVNPEVNPNLSVERLGPNVNSDFDELKPLVSPDGNMLFFSRQNHPDNVGGIEDKEDIWYSEKGADGEWGEARNIGAPLNNEGPNFISSITPDGRSMVVLLGNQYMPNGKMRAGVSMSNREGSGWSDPENIEIENDYNLSPQANFFMANNRKTLLMSVERDDSRGDRDLYVSFQQSDGKWSEPLNLGDIVNTASVESAPFLAPDDRTLYFSSKGYSGFGELDIYVTRRLDDTWTSWSEPMNLGPNINSPEDDLFFTIPANGEEAYFSRGMKGENVDIFRFGMPNFYRPDPVVKITGIVRNKKNNEPLEAKIFYEKLPQGEEVGIAQADPQTGKYSIILPYGELYGYLAEKEGYLSENANIDLREVSDNQTITKDLYLAPIEKEAVISLNNIFFDFDKSSLKPESYPELNRTAEVLKNNPSVKIEIAGHTDNIGSDAYNQRLSERRANSVKQYLLNKGIAADRLVAKGYGESRPIATNDQEVEGRELNRRVEMKIIQD
ncbi:OmpA family protein [Roseivirga sp. BDSF3-8]|uniref:OmpA family protein n=1 Tax=Roseivirga sp. BDSF3-8 TaxID=3241598 RepID=UPI003532668C